MPRAPRSLSAAATTGVLVAGLLLPAPASGAAPAAAAAAVPSAALPAAAPAAVATAARKPVRVAAVYRGRAGCPGCSEAVARMLARETSATWRVRYVGERERYRVASASLRGVHLYVQPGGWGTIGPAWRALGPTGQRAVRAYVAGGGRYLGLCMGGFLAGRFGSVGWGWLSGIDTYRGRDARSVLLTRWQHVPRRMYWAGGPRFSATKAGTRVHARYSNGQVAALVAPAGRGRVGVIGPHAEADRSWYRAGRGTSDPDGYDAGYGGRIVRALFTF